MEVRIYREGDDKRMTFRRNDSWGVNREQLLYMATQCPSWTFFIDGKPLMIFGAWPLWKGAWEAWAMPTDDLRGHGLAVIRTMRHAIELFKQRDDVDRLTCMVREFDTEYQKYMRLLGFRIEYVLDKAYDGKYDIYGYKHGLKKV